MLAPVTNSKVCSLSPLTALVFDSGMGGLSVYQEIHHLMPGLHVIYAFDNEGFPYGEKSDELIIDRVTKMLSAICARHHVDIIVIACNTASTIVLPTLRAKFSQPIVGVVPAIKPAVKLTKKGVIGLLATRATVKRIYTQQLIKEFAHNCHIELMGSSRLVELAEGKLRGELVNTDEIKLIFQPWLSMNNPPDTIILGCTHFPLLKSEIASVLPVTTQLVDSGEAVARRVYQLLNKPVLKKVTMNNIAYCSALDDSVLKLKKMLKNRGFCSILEQSVG